MPLLFHSSQPFNEIEKTNHDLICAYCAYNDGNLQYKASNGSIERFAIKEEDDGVKATLASALAENNLLIDTRLSFANRANNENFLPFNRLLFLYMNMHKNNNVSNETSIFNNEIIMSNMLECDAIMHKLSGVSGDDNSVIRMREFYESHPDEFKGQLLILKNLGNTYKNKSESRKIITLNNKRACECKSMYVNYLASQFELIVDPDHGVSKFFYMEVDLKGLIQAMTENWLANNLFLTGSSSSFVFKVTPKAAIASKNFQQLFNGFVENFQNKLNKFSEKHQKSLDFNRVNSLR
ncbi:MAG: hypothetical protein V4496_07385 [Pseudomonadota bacterium]